MVLSEWPAGAYLALNPLHCCSAASTPVYTCCTSTYSYLRSFGRACTPFICFEPLHSYLYTTMRLPGSMRFRA